MFNDQAVFDAKVTELREKAERIEEFEPEAAVEAEPEPEPVPEPFPEPDPVEWAPLPVPDCTEYTEHYYHGPTNGNCYKELTSDCLKCSNLRRELSLVAQDGVYGWSDWELRQFLENLGFAVHTNETTHTMQEKVRNILDTMKMVAKIASLKGDAP